MMRIASNDDGNPNKSDDNPCGSIWHDALGIPRAYQDLGWGLGATSQKWWFDCPSAGRIVLWFFFLAVGFDWL